MQTCPPPALPSPPCPFYLPPIRPKMVDVVSPHTMPSETEVHVARSFLTKILRSSMRYHQLATFLLWLLVVCGEPKSSVVFCSLGFLCVHCPQYSASPNHILFSCNLPLCVSQFFVLMLFSVLWCSALSCGIIWFMSHLHDLVKKCFVIIFPLMLSGRTASKGMCICLVWVKWIVQ